MITASPTQPIIRDTRRRTPDDPAFTRLRDVTTAHLVASVWRYVRELRQGHRQHGAAQSAFIQRHLGLLREAYIAAYKAGQRDYWRTVSLTPKRWPLIEPDEYRMRRTLTYYGAVSVAKLAREGIAAWHQREVTQTQTLADAGDGADPLEEWFNSLGARISLQADLTWSAGEQGYVDAGGKDIANPYDELWWDLEPAAQHCADCPPVAEGSPYTAPGTGQNELDQTPGDGRTECGANCKCSLRWAYMGGPAFYDWSDFFPPDMPGMPSEGLTPAAPPMTQADIAHEYFERVFPDAAQEAAMDAGLTDAQKAALDKFRAQWQQWQYYRGMFPQAPDLFNLDIDIEQLPPWDQLTPEQQEILQGMYDALEDWNAASEDAESDDSQQFSEPEHGRYQLFNPNHLPPGPKGGQFAPKGAGGAGEADALAHTAARERVARSETRMRQADAEHAHQVARYRRENGLTARDVVTGSMARADPALAAAGAERMAAHIEHGNATADLTRLENAQDVALRTRVNEASLRVNTAMENVHTTYATIRQERGLQPGEHLPHDEPVDPRLQAARDEFGAAHAAHQQAMEELNAFERATGRPVSDPNAAEDRAEEAQQRLFGRQLSDEEMRSIVGAPKDAEVSFSSEDGRELNIILEGEIGDHASYTADRTVGKDGRWLVMHNNYFRVEGEPGQGHGTRIFADQVKGASAMGVKRIETQAARGPEFNGYYTWARLGYDAPLSGHFRAMLPESLAGATRVSDLMRTPEGRSWWKTNGDTTEMTFDLREGSRSRRRLDAYMREKGYSE